MCDQYTHTNTIKQISNNKKNNRQKINSKIKIKTDEKKKKEIQQQRLTIHEKTLSIGKKKQE